ncbi:hypothetical protein O6H91_05G096700 [Diphasiastrum complanatum]|uniref:Uncharacterized protein n=1 Tax=Diphasiastrum complanatum TaxID=34168 RepID=A0ACC2DRE2_DIPCM|nr:hypothetical protein O6H91_05G096700 [Diphasiastrum complanatum]
MEVHLGALPFDLDFHPSASLVSVGLITGHLHLHSFCDGEGDGDGDGATQQQQQHKQLWSVRPHKESCRAVRFAEAGRYLLTGSPDCSIHATDVETGKPVARLSNAHASPINRIINATETTVASGDDEGVIKIWDTRQNTCCGSFNVHEDYISDMEYVPDGMQLLGVSGDGTLSLCNLRSNRVQARSEFSEDELLSVIRVKNGQKVVCGSQEGVVLLYSWGQFEDCSDRFLGHPHSVEALLKVDEDTILTGSSDGIIRVVSILPNKMIGLIGEHSEFPVERLAFSHDRAILGSVSHDNSLKLWDVRYLIDDAEPETGENSSTAKVEAASEDKSNTVEVCMLEADPEEEEIQKNRRKRKGKGIASSGNSSSDFFADL